MTQQQQEILIYRGRIFNQLSRPLEQCGDGAGLDLLSSGGMCHSALHRGYRGTWELAQRSLWLVALHGATFDPEHRIVRRDECEHENERLPAPVHANWFTGELRIGRGKAQSVGQYAIDWPYYRVFHVERGRVTGTVLVDNRAKFRAGVTKGRKIWEILNGL